MILLNKFLKILDIYEYEKIIKYEIFYSRIHIILISSNKHLIELTDIEIPKFIKNKNASKQYKKYNERIYYLCAEPYTFRYCLSENTVDIIHNKKRCVYYKSIHRWNINLSHRGLLNLSKNNLCYNELLFENKKCGSIKNMINFYSNYYNWYMKKAPTRWPNVC